MILPNGTLLQGGKYRIEEKIGQGGFGITYRACQPLMLDRKVCIKEFYLKQCFSRESTSSAITYPNDSARKDAEIYQQKFIKEAQTLYSMHHPNIMEIYDIFEENNTAYYVMEYIEGESLKDMLVRRGSIPEAEAIGYIRKVAEALKYIHSRNFNHFDVKPDNILVRSSDKEVILIDFGTAKHYDSNTGNATTMTAGLLSRGYAPIEQYKEGGVNTFTPETDIYALGATLYKLLTGNTPPEPTEIISNGIPELPSSVSQSTKDLIKWAMQLNKADRPHSCDEVLNALPDRDWGKYNSSQNKKESNDDSTIDITTEETININNDSPKTNAKNKTIEKPTDNTKDSKSNIRWIYFLIVVIVGCLAFVLIDNVTVNNEAQETISIENNDGNVTQPDESSEEIQKTEPTVEKNNKESKESTNEKSQIDSNKSYYITKSSPFIESCNDNTLSLDELTIIDDKTILSFTSYGYKQGWAWVQISRNCYIVAGGKKYKLNRVEGIPYAPDYKMYNDKPIYFNLFFPPIPKTVETLDFHSIGDEGAWHLLGIHTR